ncbi:hypothetical protein GHK30_29340 [Sinorhizobium medicae]|nr:hypothetical protein [Sinorhizobium medicae]
MPDRLSRAPTIKSARERSQLTASEVPMFRIHLNEAMFFYQQELNSLEPKEVSGLPAAKDNAFRMAEELVNLVIDARAVA